VIEWDIQDVEKRERGKVRGVTVRGGGEASMPRGKYARDETWHAPEREFHHSFPEPPLCARSGRRRMPVKAGKILGVGEEEEDEEEEEGARSSAWFNSPTEALWFFLLIFATSCRTCAVVASSFRNRRGPRGATWGTGRRRRDWGGEERGAAKRMRVVTGKTEHQEVAGGAEHVPAKGRGEGEDAPKTTWPKLTMAAAVCRPLNCRRCAVWKPRGGLAGGFERKRERESPLQSDAEFERAKKPGS